MLIPVDDKYSWRIFTASMMIMGLGCCSFTFYFDFKHLHKKIDDDADIPTVIDGEPDHVESNMKEGLINTLTFGRDSQLKSDSVCRIPDSFYESEQAAADKLKERRETY